MKKKYSNTWVLLRSSYVKNLSQKKVLAIFLAVACLSHNPLHAEVFMDKGGRTSSIEARGVDKNYGDLMQTTEVRGRVTDSNGDGVPGATVVAKGTAVGTATDVNGNFVLGVPSGAGTLVVSFIGYKSQEVPINNRSTINITLSEDTQALQEIVVVGYGAQEKKDILGAISVVSSKDLEERPSTNVGYSLQGKAAGVQVLRPSGKPQGGFTIRVRGTTSITGGSEPLYVVDGVPSATTFDINPNDIESISILKDASSAAIYGASGANGVVLITTKRGGDQKPRLTFNAYTGLSEVTSRIDVLDRDQYIDLMTELGQVADWDKYSANTNWHDEVFEKASSQNYQLSLNGGNQSTSYYLSGAWIEQEGVVRTNKMNRYNFKVNIDQKVNSIITVGTSLSYSKWSDRNVDDNRGSGNAGVITNVLTTAPVIGIYNADGTFTANPLRLSFHNPVAYTDGSTNEFDNSRMFGNVYGEINILQDLKFKTLFGYDNSTGRFNYFLDPFKTDWGRVNNGIANLNIDQNQYWLSENTLSYSKTFNDVHEVEALAGFTASKANGESSAVETKGFSGISVPTVNGGSIINSATGSRSERTNSSFISRVRYSYHDKYLLTSNFRADASSVFGPENRWGYFPSFSVGWRISEENFLKDVRGINDLKIRFAWGKVGNDRIGAYAWYGLIGTGSNYILGDQVSSGTSPSTPENRNLKWEATTQKNIGLDLAILNSRVNFSLDLYQKNTSDLLFDKPVPTSSGFSGALLNIGELENKGIEFALNTRNFVKEFTWDTDFNISFNRNKVGYIGDQVLPVGSIPQRQQAAIIKEGLPIGTFWGYVAEGVDPATGMMIYQDIDKSGTIDADDRTVIGNANPKFSLGLTNNFSFKNWSLGVFFQGIYGNDVFNATRIEIEGMNDFRNQSAAVLDRWTESGQITDVPKAIYGNTSNSDISTRFIEDGSYLRLKSLTLGYRIPESIVNKINLQNVNLYVTGENLLTFTKYSGYDPEVSAFAGQGGATGNGALGIDFGTYPQIRELIFGLSVSF